MREQLKELTKQYDKSENDLKALQSVGQVSIVFSSRLRAIADIYFERSRSLDEYVNLPYTYTRYAAEF